MAILGGHWTLKGARNILYNYKNYSEKEIIAAIRKITINGGDYERLKLCIKYGSENISQAAREKIIRELYKIKTKPSNIVAKNPPQLLVMEKGLRLQLMGDGLKSKKGIKLLIKIMGDKKENMPVRKSASDALLKVRNIVDKEVTIQFIKLLKGSYRYIAVKVLGNLGDKRAVAPLIEVSSADDNSDVRREAKVALKKLNPDEVML